MNDDDNDDDDGLMMRLADDTAIHTEDTDE